MAAKGKKLNLLLIGVDSMRADHMSFYGYPRLTTPHLDRFMRRGTAFENAFSPHIPTTPGYGSMFTGMDCFGMDVVALRHQGGLGGHLKTLAEILSQAGYATTCVGFKGNAASRGFQNYIDFEGWGSWQTGRARKAENLNHAALPELRRLAKGGQPFFLFLRHMDPHSPYLPPTPFDRAFYEGDELDKGNTSLEPVYKFKPSADYFTSWFPPGCADKEYIIAQYDGALAYMDACIANIFTALDALELTDDTLVVIDSDHGETLYDHDCYFDHHGLYECTLRIPLAFILPGKVPAGRRARDIVHMKDIAPTILDLLGVKTDIAFDGRSLRPLIDGKPFIPEPEFYITECTWMRKHGWRTPQWKLIHALEPDFHFKSEVELYDLVRDPGENRNLAAKEPAVAALLEDRMKSWIARREKQTGRTAPIFTNLNWHGKGCGAFTSSQQAYDSMHIGSPAAARNLQELQRQRGQQKL